MSARKRIEPVADSALGRSLELISRFGSGPEISASSRDVASATDTVLRALVAAAVEEFCEWCVIDTLDAAGARHHAALGHRSCDGEDPERCCVPALLDRIPDFAALTSQVLAGDHVVLWPHQPPSQCVALGMRVNAQLFAVVTFVAIEHHPGYGDAEVVAARQVVDAAAGAIERIHLAHEGREALRQGQRIAVQLHQLIAASIAVAGSSDEHDILLSLAARTLSVFDARSALVTLESDSSRALRALADADGTRWIDPEDPVADSLPSIRHAGTRPWREGEWLVAPVFERRNRPRGVIAVRADPAAPLGAESTEVLVLLAQMAAATLGAAELSASVHNSETRWRVLVDTAPVGIVDIDVEGHVRWWNRAAGTIFLWEDYDENRDATPQFPADSRDDLDSLRADVLAGATVHSRELFGIDIAGRTRDLRVSATPLPSPEHHAPSILALVDDVTDFRQMRAELRHAQGMEIRGQVASSVAHDFNNLLTLISGYAEILSQDLADDERALEMVRDIQATASRASLLTGQLQTIGRTKAPEPVVIDPRAAIQSNAEVLERILGADIELAWSLDESTSTVRVDADRFEQMILNLAINARDAMPRGGRLVVTVRTLDPSHPAAPGEGPYVLIAISDTGIGMSEETAARCFEPFYTTKGLFKGTGLGLSTARRLVEESDGVITCSSQLGVGTTFEVYLPALDQPADEDATPAPVADERARGSATVLLAEDDEGLRRLMVQVLRRNGYRVLETPDGQRALEVARDFDETIDLLVSDVVMPQVTGDELARTLQRERPTLRVLLLSGSADASVLDDLAPATSAFLAKPFKPSQLIDRIHALLTPAAKPVRRAD